MRAFIRGVIVCAALSASFDFLATSTFAADFYKGKTITIVTGDGGGGLYDLVSRTVAKYLPQYIPGNPSIIVQGMPGASQVRATVAVQNVFAPDGLTLGMVQPYVMLNKILNPSADYNPRSLTWITRILPLTQIGFSMSRTGVSTLNDLRSRSLNIGAAGATGPAAMVPWALNRMTGTKFHVVMGYTDDAAEFLALERGELEGMGSINYAALVHRPEWIEKKMFAPLYAIALNRLSGLPDTPTILELTKEPKDLAILKILATIPAIGITIMAPPNVPADRVELLRTASDRMNLDPGFIADMKKMEMVVDPLSGSDVANLVAQATTVDAEQLKDIVKYTAPMP